MILRGVNNTTGIGSVEVYDLGTASFDTSSESQLAQISTRGHVQTGDNVMIGGFILVGSDPVSLVLRGLGPTVSDQDPNVTDGLADPTIDLVDSNGVTLGSNDNWQDNSAADIQVLQQQGLEPAHATESAVVATLSQGGYTAIVWGKNNTMGVGLVEVYVLQ